MTPTWFGPDDVPLFGWYHAPADGLVRGVVVLCPPVGLEMLVTYRTFRVLAEQLAAAGLGVLRFGYATTGDSAGEATDPDRVGRWLASVADAVGYVRGAGARHVVVVGMRLGATLAASAARPCAPWDGVVLWDPCESGGSFLREEQVLFRMGVPAEQRTPPRDGAIEGPGSLYQPEMVTALRGLAVEALIERDGEGTAVFPGVGGVLVVTRSESRARGGVRQLVEVAGVESFEASGQPALFDWARLEVPLDAIAAIVDWVSTRAPAERTRLELPTRDVAVVATTPDGRPVRERVVRIGDAGLFGIVTEVEPSSGAAMVLTNAAPPACHLGPARLWVGLARTWAEQGMTVLRFDDAGIGDSPGGDTEVAPSVYSEATIRDVVAAVDAMRARGAREVSLTGLCAAAWACLLAAARVQVEAVNAINPGGWDVRPSHYVVQPSTQLGGSVPDGRPPVRARLTRRIRAAARLAVRRFMPEPLWWRLGARGYIEAPAGMITPLVRRGTEVRLLLGHREGSAFRERRGARLLAAYGRSGLLQAHEAEDIDHALMGTQARDAVQGQLAEWTRPRGRTEVERAGTSPGQTR